VSIPFEPSVMSFKINRVYTRTGDSGETSLVGGDRVSKAHYRVDIFGGIDEMNSCLGIVKESIPSGKLDPLSSTLEYIQQELFDLGAEIATPFSSEYPEMWKVNEGHVTYLEKLCDFYGQDLPELSSFILPGGSVVVSYLHLARTVCRRVERDMVRSIEVSGADEISAEAIRYINRLSDLLFNMCRWSLAQEGKNSPLWTKEVARKKPI
jgi:cob(I)alamin adenosyltransferase